MNIFWLLARVAGWLVGIYALLKLAVATGAVTYTQMFQAWMHSLRDIADLGFLLTPLKMAVILPALDFIRSFNIPIPPLQDHWQQVFLLVWLFAAAVARNKFWDVPTPAALLAAFCCTLPFCVAAGTMPLSSYAVFTWPAAGFVTFQCFGYLLGGQREFALYGFPVVLFFVAFAFLPGTDREGMGQLVVLAAFVCGVGALLLVSGLIASNGTFWQRLEHKFTATGLDITAVMLGAFGLATACADPPLF